MKHKFTVAECKQGGKIRAAQKAAWRKNNPTEAEQHFRRAVSVMLATKFSYRQHKLCIKYEFPIQTTPELEQYLDIALWIDDKMYAIEVDGSKGWHKSNQKSAPYDELKARHCNKHNILLFIMTYKTWKDKGIEQAVEYLLGKILENENETY